MPYVHIDVDLDEFDTDELVEEITRRIKKAIGRKSLKEEEKKDLKQCALDILEAFKLTPSTELEIKTLDDKMKYEHFCRVFNKYTVSAIESKLP